MGLRATMKKVKVQRVDIEVNSMVDLGGVRERYLGTFVGAAMAAYVATYLLLRVRFFGYTTTGIILTTLLSLLFYAAGLVEANRRADRTYKLVRNFRRTVPLADALEGSTVVINYGSNTTAEALLLVASVVSSVALTALALLGNQGPFAVERGVIYFLNMLESLIALSMVTSEASYAFSGLQTEPPPKTAKALIVISINGDRRARGASRGAPELALAQRRADGALP